VIYIIVPSNQPVLPPDFTTIWAPAVVVIGDVLGLPIFPGATRSVANGV